ncbi:MAG: calcium-binding protein [Thermomonas sp.]|nr:MAG: calcium-binding protein [Thermomonas sp.]
MKHFTLLAVAVTVALASAATFAQTSSTTTAAAPRTAIDANQDGVIDRAEAAKAPRLAARFDQLDQNKDGRLSADERPHRGMHHRGGKRGAHARMQRADTDRDGRISRAEAQAAQAQHAGRFDELDVNKDGYLDRADRQARMAQRRGECFTKADTDRNGQLSRAEFENAHCGGGVAGRMPRNNPNPGPLPPKK